MSRVTTDAERNAIQQAFRQKLDEDELLNCMRCGFCLPACPTYIMTKQEAASPRGRIALMKGVYDGTIAYDDDIGRQLDLCLGCRACETACPSGVKYGHLLENARSAINENKRKTLKEKAIRKLTFKDLFPNQKRMRQVTGLVRLYQKSGLKKLAEATGAINILPETLRTMQSILPEIPDAKAMRERPVHLAPIFVDQPSAAETATTHANIATNEEAPINHNAENPVKRVAFFAGCLMDTMFLKTNEATLKLLQLSGCEIFIPPDQACCGALHGHSGEAAGARELAKRNIEAFEKLDCDTIVTNAGGCGAYLIDYAHLLADDPEWSERAARFSSCIKDLSEVLLECGFLEKYHLSLPNQVVTFQDSCHLRNVMQTATAPRRLLQAIDGITYRELKEANVCCGSAGIYNLLHEDMATSLIDRKMVHVQDIMPHVIVTANPGCLLQMKFGIKRRGLESKMEAVHIADLLLKSVSAQMEKRVDSQSFSVMNESRRR